jgi:hypothetical protein
MLQQTQVSRVLGHYPRFLRRFPSMRSLARARQRDVVLAWRGMGYNNRAEELGRAIHPEFSPHDLPWLEMLLEGLERDGLVRIRRGRTLPGSRVVPA